MSIFKGNGARVSFAENNHHDRYSPYGITASTATSAQAEAPNEPWDTFEMFPSTLRNKGSTRENKCLDNATRFAKVLVYSFCFAIVLFGGLCANVALSFGVSQMRDGKVTYCSLKYEPRGDLIVTRSPRAYLLHTWTLVLVVVTPDVLCLLTSLCAYSSTKKNCAKLHLSGVIILLVLETLNCIGLGMMIFGGLERIDSLEVAALVGMVYCVPGILNLLSRSGGFLRKRMLSISLAMDVLAVLIQISGLIYIHVIGAERNTDHPWMLPLSLVLTSARYWGNFVSRRSSFGFIRQFSCLARDTSPAKSYFTLHLSLYRIVLFYSVCLLSLHLKNHSVSQFFTAILDGSYQVLLHLPVNGSAFAMSFKPNGWFYEVEEISDETIVIKVSRVVQLWGVIVAGCGFLIYQTAKFTYKTYMHILGFAIPINLVVPAVISSLAGLTLWREDQSCSLREAFPDFLLPDLPRISNDPSYFTDRVYIWILLFLSQLWITRHCFHVSTARLARTRSIFWATSYDGSFIGILLQLNKRKEGEQPEEGARRRNEDGNEPRFDLQADHFTESPLPPLPQGPAIRNGKRPVRRLYACATMWHEERAEMNELIGSILRLDRDQCAMRVTQACYGVDLEDYYELETHIFFDDAFRCMHDCETSCTHDDDESRVNNYVLDLLEIVEHNVKLLCMKWSHPIKYPTPYGGRLEWTLPGKTKLTVHLKDKNKIRHRKRWSQVMYMYYLLGHRLMAMQLSPREKEEIAENTFILTLDGDVDFQPASVKILLDLMKKDKELGAACGRIHPIGRGPMVWFQKFEYAIGHWLQKSTEHTIGCVLCSPGCFSLFRAKALMRHNVIAKYATRSNEPRHYVQYDQGEDRWLCTLVLQAGCRVEYSAASDAYTHAPEKFHEFFIQRRRWIPSTVANIFDLLGNAAETRKVNRDISWWYICYQWVLMGSTILGPGTIFLMMVGATVATFHIDNWTSFSYNLVPILIFIFICYFCKERTQLMSAQILSAIYALVMVIVLVGIMLQITEDGLLSPSTLLFFIIAGQFVVTGILHPKELDCLLCGIIYYISVPSMYMILIVYSIFNVHNVTWGTREKKSRAAEEAERVADARERQEEERVRGKEKGNIELSLAKLFRCYLCIYRDKTDYEKQLETIQASLDKVIVSLNEIEGAHKLQDGPKENGESLSSNSIPEDDLPASSLSPHSLLDNSGHITPKRDICSEISRFSEGDHSHYLISPHWLQDERMRKGDVDFLSNSEEEFWNGLIDKYLYPLDNDAEKQKETASQLLSLRNEYLTKFFMINALFILSLFLMQLNKDTLHLQWPLGIKYNIIYNTEENTVIIEKKYLRLEPIGCLFIAGYFTILLIQFLAMLLHRFDTFMHILAYTSLETPFFGKEKYNSDEEMLDKHAEDIVKGLQVMIENETVSAFERRRTVTEFDGIYRQSWMTSFENVFQRKLDESNSKGFPRVISSKLTRKTLEAFKNRRNKVLAKNAPKNEDGIYENDSDMQSRGNYGFDNPSFHEQ